MIATSKKMFLTLTLLAAAHVAGMGLSDDNDKVVPYKAGGENSFKLRSKGHSYNCRYLDADPAVATCTRSGANKFFAMMARVWGGKTSEEVKIRFDGGARFSRFSGKRAYTDEQAKNAPADYEGWVNVLEKGTEKVAVITWTMKNQENLNKYGRNRAARILAGGAVHNWEVETPNQLGKWAVDCMAANPQLANGELATFKEEVRSDAETQTQFGAAKAAVWETFGEIFSKVKNVADGAVNDVANQANDVYEQSETMKKVGDNFDHVMAKGEDTWKQFKEGDQNVEEFVKGKIATKVEENVKAQVKGKIVEHVKDTLLNDKDVKVGIETLNTGRKVFSNLGTKAHKLVDKARGFVEGESQENQQDNPVHSGLMAITA